MRRLPTALSLLAVLVGSVSGCAETTPRTTSIDIVIEDGTVTPNGDRVPATVDEPITLTIDADTAGELHVHSSPERKIPYEAATTTETLTISRPGVVDVEDQHLEQVVVQLQVE